MEKSSGSLFSITAIQSAGARNEQPSKFKLLGLAVVKTRRASFRPRSEV